MKLCECGCGKPAGIATQTQTTRGYVKGQPTRYAYGHTGRRATVFYRQRGETSEYVHRTLAARALGRPLPVGVDVHHVDQDIHSDTPRLVICQDRAYHKLLHVRARVQKAGGNPNTDRICSKCRQVLPFSAFNNRRGNVSTGLQSACRECMNAYRRERKRSDRAA